MPPLIVWALAVLGAAALTRWIAAEARRVNAELHPERRAPEPDLRHDAIQTLEYDPATGTYRPR